MSVSIEVQYQYPLGISSEVFPSFSIMPLGRLYANRDGRWHHDPIVNPKPDDELLRWMLIDPSYQDELETEDYERCIASAMDVGQYKFDLDYLMKSDRRPDVIFR